MKALAPAIRLGSLNGRSHWEKSARQMLMCLACKARGLSVCVLGGGHTRRGEALAGTGCSEAVARERRRQRSGGGGAVVRRAEAERRRRRRGLAGAAASCILMSFPCKCVPGEAPRP